MARKLSMKKQAEADIESLTALVAVQKFISAEWKAKYKAEVARDAIRQMEEARVDRDTLKQLLGVRDG